MSAEGFIADLLASMPTPEARLRACACLAKYSGLTIYLPVEPKKDRRVRAAANMLRNQMAESDSAAAIVERYNVSVRTAQRDVAEARKMSSKNVVSR